MKWLTSDSKNPYYNLALEEYVFANCTEGQYLILWVNEDAVVVGRNQNIFEEAEVELAELDDIALVRRNTGGGTVFHDKGNINFSFIRDFSEGEFSEYDSFLQPMIQMLRSLGIPAEKKNHSDIVAEGRKISGNAQVIKKGRILHHGTLLFDADLKKLGKYLRKESDCYQSKSVKSVRSRVTNIAEYVDMNMEAMEQYMIDYFCKDGGRQLLTMAEEQAIALLAREKYSSWNWNIGKSPKFTASESRIHQGKAVNFQFHVDRGIIEHVEMEWGTEKFDRRKELLLKERLGGQRYSERLIRQEVSKILEE